MPRKRPSSRGRGSSSSGRTGSKTRHASTDSHGRTKRKNKVAARGSGRAKDGRAKRKNKAAARGSGRERGGRTKRKDKAAARGSGRDGDGREYELWLLSGETGDFSLVDKIRAASAAAVAKIARKRIRDGAAKLRVPVPPMNIRVIDRPAGRVAVFH